MAINWFAVILAALAVFFLGALWYGPLFGKAWRAQLNLGSAPRGNMAPILAGAFVLSLIQAATFALFLGPTVNPQAYLYGLCAGLCWVGAAFVIQYLFEGKSWKLMAINAGYNGVGFTLIGLIVGGWH